MVLPKHIQNKVFRELEFHDKNDKILHDQLKKEYELVLLNNR